MRSIILAVLTMSWMLSVAVEAQENWPRFRGPNGTGVVADDPRLPDTWDREKNVKWVTDIQGWGWSSPVIWGNKVFLTGGYSDAKEKAPPGGYTEEEGFRFMGEWKPYTAYHWMVYCLDIETGDEIWSREVHTGMAEGRSQRRVSNSWASSTPAIDGERLYAFFGEFGLYCFDLDGNPLWTYPLPSNETFFNYGYGTSPIAHDGRVIFTYDNEEESFIAALDGKTGEEVWKTEREEATSYATPLIWKNELRTEIFTAAQKRIRSYSLDGTLLWDMEGGMTMNCIPSPLLSHGMVFASSGYYKFPHRPVYAFKPGASGDISMRSWGKDGNIPRGGTEKEVAKMSGDVTLDSLSNNEKMNEFVQWYLPIGSSEITSPIVYGDYYYTLMDQGFLNCHDAKTGEEVYERERLRGRFMSSPWAYNDRLFCLNEKGKTYVVKPGPDFEILQQNDLKETCIATPAIAQGKLLIRTETKLYCITEDGK